MPNVVVVLDGNPTDRATFIERAESRIAPLDGMETSHQEGDGWAAVWAIGERIPRSSRSDRSGSTLLFGEAIDDSGRRLSAMDLSDQLARNPSATWSGFHLAIDVTGPGSLSASVDIMGILPLYYWQGSGVTLIGTSIDLFYSHPRFRASFDARGLVGILMMNGLVGGRSLLEGVRRLDVRHRLWVRDGKLAEKEHYRPPQIDPKLMELPIEGHVEILGEALDAAMKRQTMPDVPHGILLSGGFDS
ncbi:MAG TPA: asparagine synthase-related protein, partial [Fibrobacteria bacterium]|nr:asparagine synthase-related protein [Fibrobacteria bacterium]